MSIKIKLLEKIIWVGPFGQGRAGNRDRDIFFFGLTQEKRGPLVVLVWLGSCSSEASRRGSGLNKHVNFGFYLFLTGVRVVPEPTDTSTTIGYCFTVN